MDEQIRLRIRHYLLQQSELFRRVAALGSGAMPPVSNMAEELSHKIPLPTRRLQKYLTEELGPKEIAVSLQDLQLLAQMQGYSVTEFVAYLFQEKWMPTNGSLWQEAALAFLEKLHEGHRRALTMSLFSTQDHGKSEQLINLALQLYQLPKEDINTIESIIDAFVQRQKTK